MHKWWMAGLVWLLLVSNFAVAKSGPAPPGHKVHTYYIAAEEVDWNYAPGGKTLTGAAVSEEEDESGTAVRTVYRKAIYREYTDASFVQPKGRSEDWKHLGILGPLLRAEVGDTIRVIFKNNTHVSCTMHPHGLAYDKSSEGAFYGNQPADGRPSGDMVAPGATFTYNWNVPERAGPAAGDPDSILWMYHSHANESADVNSGLIGPIIISRPGTTRADGRPKGVDREFVADFAIFDESISWFNPAYMVANSPIQIPQGLTREQWRERNMAYTINGLIFGNSGPFVMKVGERVRWYIFANDNEEDVHTVHWHGQTAVSMHMRTDTVHLGPMSMAVVDMVPDTAGTWLLHCHVTQHMDSGMQTLFKVLP
jgi:FtsP/CotA-like multicopper oxidase with cupredoxin domain